MDDSKAALVAKLAIDLRYWRRIAEEHKEQIVRLKAIIHYQQNTLELFMEELQDHWVYKERTEEKAEEATLPHSEEG